ncbi:hypothetical protein [Variovorax sp. PvP013]|uniref:hypothetical protein n=1 Tax=Variovorax sp. PvP013 TaxID=3156435 RepID=UPI003D1B36F3
MTTSAQTAYEQAFQAAITFTKEKRLLQLGADKISTSTPANYERARSRAVYELEKAIIPGLKNAGVGEDVGEIKGDGEFWALGSQCGNAHLHACNNIEDMRLPMSCHLTIGGVQVNSDHKAFPYTRAQFLQDMEARPEIIRGHVWLTLGGEYIVDLTLGTWLTTAEKPYTQYGSVISGVPGAFDYQNFLSDKSAVHNEPPVIYTPVAVGLDALKSVAPLL